MPDLNLTRYDGHTLPPVLDPCCGSRMWWFDHADSRALYGDRRRETTTVKDTTHGRAEGRRVLRIDPDVDLDFRAMPFPSDSFYLVAFDPPHLVRAGARSWMAAKYGTLGPDWRHDLAAGFRECFRVLRPGGVLVFKWNETQVRVREVLDLTPERPLFGHTSGRKSGTHWIVFMKPPANEPADAPLLLAEAKRLQAELAAIRQAAREYLAASEPEDELTGRPVMRHLWGPAYRAKYEALEQLAVVGGAL